jgi:uncharacterized protein (TIGR00369 family)
MRLDKIIKYLSQHGLVNQLGIEIKVEPEASCHLCISEAHVGKPGIAHGGAVMSLLDTALGLQAIICALEKGKVTSTVEMKINLLRPIPVGTMLITRTEVQHIGNSLLVITGGAFNQANQQQMALAIGTFNIYTSHTNFYKP